MIQCGLRQSIRASDVLPELSIPGITELIALIMARTVKEMELQPGKPIVALFKSASVERVR